MLALLLRVLLPSSYALAAHQPPTGGYRYWVKETCLQRDPNFMLYPRQVLYQARSAYNRLNDPTDGDFHNVFHAIFKTNIFTDQNYPYSPEYNHVWGPTFSTPWAIVSSTMNDLGNNWQPTNNRIDAHLRIYCDDGDRYDFSANGQLWDTIEHFYRPAGEGRVHTCKEQAHHPCYGTTFTNWAIIEGESNVPLYSVIDICQNLWDALGAIDRGRAGPVPAPRTIDRAQLAYGERERDDMHNLPVFSLGLEQMPVQTLFHEWMHAMPFFGQDYPDAMGMSGSWAHIITLDTAQALHAPETYTYLGLWAALADLNPSGYQDGGGRGGGYTIDHFWGMRPEEEKWHQNFPEENMGETDNPAFGGWITAYRDLTGRRNRRQ